VPDLTGKLAVVTGSTSGIGLETVRVLAEHGAEVILAARNELKTHGVIEQVRKEISGAKLESHVLDTSSLASVREFARWFTDLGRPLDLLINNAGIMMVPYEKSVDGNELQFATNHLGHFALTGLLLPALDAAPSARVVTVSSIAHKLGELDFADLQFEDGAGYSPTRAYRRSKLANLLFARELDRRLDAAGSSTISVAAHPGVSNTNLGNHLMNNVFLRPLQPVVSAVMQGAEAGSLPTLRAAADPDVIGGQYYGPVRRGETTGPPEVARQSMMATDPELAGRLWEASEEITSVHFL
jgi:NAD(P)-dependent dehydrogenase (short-subunit alcohol dehydrogenase family)